MMRWLRYCVFIGCLLGSALAFAQKDEWLPITPQDLQVKEVPGDPGASAIQLYYANFIDDSQQCERYYYRIKVLTDKGKQYADVEIPLFLEGTQVSELKARTIHPDGSIVQFTGKPFEKTVIKGRGIKWLVKSFTLPEVTVGSIIEYRYKLQFEGILISNEWILQSNLYTVKENFSFKPYEGRLSGSEFESGGRVSWLYMNLERGKEPKMTHGNNAELELHDIPAFHSEDYMPPENEYKPGVYFFYIGGEAKTADKYWEEIGKKRQQTIEDFIGNHKEAKEAAAQAIGDETEPGMKLRALYMRAQQIRNHSFERSRTQEERKKDNIKDRENVADVLKRGYGNHREITRTFVAMARASGFDASVLAVSDRKDKFFNKQVLDYHQLDTEIAVVKIADKELYLDPGTRFCPYGLLRWMYTSTYALKPDKKNPTLITTLAVGQDKAVTRRNVAAELTEDGSLKAEIEVQFQGLEALERRLDALDEDEAGKKKYLEDDLKEWLPSTAIVKLKNVKGWEETDDPLIATFSVEIPGYASLTGKRLLLPP